MGTTYYAVATGNWRGNIWSLASGGAVDTGHYPAAGDTVYMDHNYTVTVPSSETDGYTVIYGTAGTVVVNGTLNADGTGLSGIAGMTWTINGSATFWMTGS